jgi:hypothetical protein
LNWQQIEPDQLACRDNGPNPQRASRIVNLALAREDEHEPDSSYVEEIKAKRFKGEYPVALVAEAELLAAARRSDAIRPAVAWSDSTFLECLGSADGTESLPKAA